MATHRAKYCCNKLKKRIKNRPKLKPVYNNNDIFKHLKLMSFNKFHEDHRLSPRSQPPKPVEVENSIAPQKPLPLIFQTFSEDKELGDLHMDEKFKLS